ncbi:hypothetical protein [Streptomyces sp. YS415]|uniref:hypothetical protein n=1 Tax=Streptomyces sp. YS415 TaxID=2944806 RepID=UPI0020205D03|nr:hypothetical protein [Streptomyces sp. YS415]MCL7429780.1 hypothetical protein [Streptomyces sp. YS415]
MLSEAMTALAAAGGTAVVQAAGTDAWAVFRQQVARWFGRGNTQRESAELEQLDQTAGGLEAAGQPELERAFRSALWQARIEALLESLDNTERDQAAEELRALLAQHTFQDGASAGQDEPAAGGIVNIIADHGSIAADVVHGKGASGPPVVRHTSPGPENDPDDDWPQES